MNIGNFKSWCKRHQIALSAICTALPLIIGLYFERDNIGQLGFPLSFNDLVQALGQFATVGAFWLGFKQLRKSNEQALEQAAKEQQMIFMNAAQVQLHKMSTELHRFDLGKNDVIKLCDFVSTMANLGGNFHGIYSDLSDGPEKRVLRIGWQDMFWNELHPRLGPLLVQELINHRVSTVNIAAGLFHAAEKQRTHRYKEQYREYYKAVNILEACADNMNGQELKQLTDDHTSFTLFRMYYFEREYVEDYCNDLMSKPDFRHHVPAIAAFEFYFSNPRASYPDDPITV